MTNDSLATQARRRLEELRADPGGNRLGERIDMEVSRLRLEGQDELADALAALREEEDGQ